MNHALTKHQTVLVGQRRCLHLLIKAVIFRAKVSRHVVVCIACRQDTGTLVICLSMLLYRGPLLHIPVALTIP